MKVYETTLECGCMIAPDTGTPRRPDGNAGMLPCYAEYGDMYKEEDKKALGLHNKCIKEHFKTHDIFGNIKKKRKVK